MFPECKTMDVYLGCSSKDIGLSTHFFLSTLSEHLYGHRIDVIELFVCKGNENFLKTVIFMVFEGDGFMVRLIADVADVLGSKLEELGFFPFVALKKLSLSLGILSYI
jgi:hypothetical protein